MRQSFTRTIGRDYRALCLAGSVLMAMPGFLECVHAQEVPAETGRQPDTARGADSAPTQPVDPPSSETFQPASTEPSLEEAKLEQTDEVVVSAIRARQPVSQVTSAVEVITGDEMLKRNIKTVAEALRLATGMAIFSSGAQGTLTNAKIRGSNTAQVLVMIDGAIVNSATAGGYDFAFLTTDNIERVEILRGNQSMQYGSDAMGGVINITTKRGRGAALTTGGFVEYGSYSSLREGGSVSGEKGPFDFSATLTHWDINSVSAINYRRGASEQDGFRNWQGSGRLGLNLPTKGRLEFDIRWMNSFTNFDGFNNINPADVLGAGTRDQQFIYSGNYFQPLTSWWSSKITASRATENLTTRPGTFFRDVLTGETGVPFQFFSDIRTYSNRIDWQNTFQIIKPLAVVAGYQFREQLGSNTDPTGISDFPSKRVASNAGYGEAQLNVWDRVFGTAGFRQDEYNVFGSATTYRFTAGYLHKETGTKIRASYATGFRAPTVNELFFPNFGNSNLRPEKSQGGDIGVDQTLFDKRLTLTATYFWTKYRDQILTVFSPASCPPETFGFCPQNFGSTSAKGVEVGLKVNLLRDLRWVKSLDVQGQYTHTATRNYSNPDNNTRLPQWPVHQYSAVISYRPIDPLLMKVEFRYVGQRFNDARNAQPMPAFDVWNLAASYEVVKQVQVYLRADNLFDRRYEEILYFGVPGRSVYGGIRINLDLL
ncbi:MAG TPA: TonB-dependent receptor [Nitrospira sp.]|nr:TonB-dependent receptor [Nitrospira sp.]